MRLRGQRADAQEQNDAARDVNIALGKILRVNPDGSVPTDNPFVGQTANPCADDGRTEIGKHCPETFAWGFRNPFRMAFAPDGRLFVNDVGGGTWEEVDDVQAGKDYGWNVREGHCAIGSTTSCAAPPAGMTNPIYDYSHAATGCRSITGGAFVPNAVWPAEYRGDYLFADFVCGKISAPRRAARWCRHRNGLRRPASAATARCTSSSVPTTRSTTRPTRAVARSARSSTTRRTTAATDGSVRE